ncbi:MAG: helix-turn-helix domain-containing protein [Coriobacteriales bacterium]|nr:helix-turn-helix domain-containing protein [Coriobacteriales bacterium]
MHLDNIVTNPPLQDSANDASEETRRAGSLQTEQHDGQSPATEAEQAHSTVKVDTVTLPPLIKTKTAAFVTDSDVRTMRRMCERGEIKATKIGSEWRINSAALLSKYGLA